MLTLFKTHFAVRYERHFYYFLSVVLLASTQFFINWLLSKNLSVADYGLFSLVNSILSILLSLFMFGQATAISIAFFSNKKDSSYIGLEVIKSLKIIFTSIIFFSLTGYFFGVSGLAIKYQHF